MQWLMMTKRIQIPFMKSMKGSYSVFEILTVVKVLNLEKIYQLSILIHAVVVLLVVTACDVVHPFLIVEVPFDCLLNAFLKLK